MKKGTDSSLQTGDFLLSLLQFVLGLNQLVVASWAGGCESLEIIVIFYTFNKVSNSHVKTHSTPTPPLLTF